jgi:hypothetical protein
MPRPKPKKGSPRFFAAPHNLSSRAEIKLKGLLEVDGVRWEKAKRNIETWLGAYKGAVVALDNAPRPAHYVARLRKISKIISKAAPAIVDSLYWNEWVRNELIRELPDPTSRGLEARERALIEIGDAANAALKRFEGIKSQGRPPHAALQTIIDNLRKVFETYYRGGETKRIRYGAISSLSAREAEEREFVRFAIEDAKILLPQNLGQFFLSSPKKAPVVKVVKQARMTARKKTRR